MQINSFLSIFHDEQANTLDIDPNRSQAKITSVHIIGNVLGAYRNGQVVNKDILINRLRDSRNKPKDVQAWIRCAVGNFYCIVASSGQSTIYASSGGHGFFYINKGNKWIISNTHDHLLKYLPAIKLNDFEVLQYFLLGGERPSPFTGMIQGLNSVMGGCALTIQTDSPEHIFTFSHKSKFNKYSPWKNYSKYVDAIEGQARVIANHASENDIPLYFMLSGGIDSTVSVLALKRAGANIQPITLLPKNFRDQKAFENTASDSAGVSKAMEINTIYPPFDELDPLVISKTREFNQTFGSATYLTSACMGDPHLLNDRRALVMSGDGMDTISYINYLHGKSRFPWKNKKGRYSWNRLWVRASMYALWYQGVVLEKSWLGKLTYNLLKKGFDKFGQVMPANAYEYLLAMLLSTKVFTSLEETPMPKPLSTLTQDYRDYKATTALKPLLGKWNLSDLKNNRLSLFDFCKLAKRVSFATYFRETEYSYFLNAAYIGKYDALTFPTQGPLLECFSGMAASHLDVIFAKRHSYKYFKKSTGQNYWDVVFDKESNEESARRNIPKISYLDYFSKSPQWLKHMTSEIKTTDSAVLDNIQNPLIKEYLVQHYKKCRNINQITQNSDIFKIMDIVRLETFIRKKFSSHN